MAREEKDGSVLSVRLSAREMASLKDAAVREGGRVSDVIREALGNYTSRRQDASVQWAIPENSRVFMYQGGPAKSESLSPSDSSSLQGLSKSESDTSST
jgi:hypothetical protein